MSNIEGTFTITKFDGSNFHLWKLKVRMILEELELWSLIEGTEQRPKVEDNIQDFAGRLSIW